MKDKFSKQLLMYEKFWKREKLSRPILNISTQKKEFYKKPESIEQKWLDENFIVGSAIHDSQSREFLAEGIPFLFTNFGAGCLSACIGGDYQLSENTIWFDRNPIIDDWEKLPEIKFDTNSEMWQNVERVQKKAFRHSEFNTSITDIGGILDIICSLRGTENMLYDLYDYPDEVKAMTKHVTKLWFEAFELQKEAVKNAGQPYNNWMNIPSSKPWYPIQCDFSYMISPVQFEKFVLPHIIEQVNHLERSVYHLDGVGEIPHLDMLLDIEDLTAIQWVPGGGQPPKWDEKWFSMYKKIQDKKKNLVLNGGFPLNDLKAAEKIIKSLEPTGVYISFTAPDKDTAERIVELIEKWSN